MAAIPLERPVLRPEPYFRRQPAEEATPQRIEQASERAGLSGLLARATWMFWGNGALYILGVAIAMGSAALSAIDLAFWGTVALLIGIRYWDIKKLHGLTATCEPATMSHWRRYAVKLSALSLIGWAVAHAIAL